MDDGVFDLAVVTAGGIGGLWHGTVDRMLILKEHLGLER